MQTFYFMDGIQPDAQSKKLMRRHVMKGKNAGRRINRPSRLALQEERKNKIVHDGIKKPIRAAETLNYKQRLRDADWIYLSLNSAARSFGNVLLPFSLKAQITPASLKVINTCKPCFSITYIRHERINWLVFACVADRMYPAHLGLSLHEGKMMWMHMLAADSECKSLKRSLRLYLHCLLTYVCSVSV